MPRTGKTIVVQGELVEAGVAPGASTPKAMLGERAAPSMRQANEEVGSEGARVGPLVGSAASAAVPVVPQRWSAQKKRDVVLRLLRGEPADALSRELGVESYRLEEWRKRALSGMELSLRERESDRGQIELDAAMKRIGELSMEVELLRAKSQHAGPLALRRSRP
jgi:hypothetical protein